MMRSAILPGSCLFLLGFLGGHAGAATVHACGPTICYEYDDAQAGVAKFGLPTLVGDSMQFLPVSFRAESANGAGFVVDSATFVFSRVYSVSGADIISVSVLEAGDYRIINDGMVGADLYLQATSLIDAFDFTNGAAPFDAAGDSAGLQLWSLNTAISPLAAFNGPASDMAVLVQNTLFAFTTKAGQLAWIQKKLVLEVAVVPVPAALWLFASGLGLLGWLRRRAGH